MLTQRWNSPLLLSLEVGVKNHGAGVGLHGVAGVVEVLHHLDRPQRLSLRRGRLLPPGLEHILLVLVRRLGLSWLHCGNSSILITEDGET